MATLSSECGPVHGSAASDSRCSYQGCIEQPITGKAVCFWHDRESCKTGDDIRPKLERLVREGRSLAGFKLARAKLAGIDLVCRNKPHGPDLSEADLYRADLRGAHLYRANLSNACLVKADMSQANLNFASLAGADMLGVRFERCRMEHVCWGQRICQEERAVQLSASAGSDAVRICYREAEEVCRNIRRSCEQHGLFADAGHFFYKEMRFRRYQLPCSSWQRWLSKSADLLCGYGVRPLRVFFSSAVLVLVCALFYAITPLSRWAAIVGGAVSHLTSSRCQHACPR